MKFLYMLLALCALPLDVDANWRQAGDEDPFPLSCTNFSGHWRSDSNEYLEISQEGCSWLAIRSRYDSQEDATTIVPDNKDRDFTSGPWSGVVRYRWNSKKNATIIETHRTVYYGEIEKKEVVFLEQVNEDLLLESMFRTIKNENSGGGCPPKKEYEQRMFRRINPFR